MLYVGIIKTTTNEVKNQNCQIWAFNMSEKSALTEEIRLKKFDKCKYSQLIKCKNVFQFIITFKMKGIIRHKFSINGCSCV